MAQFSSWRSRPYQQRTESGQPTQENRFKHLVCQHTANLSDAHNKLIDAIGRHEVFLQVAIVETLDGIGHVIRLELSNIRHNEHFKGIWWEDGERNRNEFKTLCNTLLKQVKSRAGELRAEMIDGNEK